MRTAQRVQKRTRLARDVLCLQLRLWGTATGGSPGLHDRGQPIRRSCTQRGAFVMIRRQTTNPDLPEWVDATGRANRSFNAAMDRINIAMIMLVPVAGISVALFKWWAA